MARTLTLLCALLPLFFYIGAKTVAAQLDDCVRPTAADLGSTTALSDSGLLVQALTSSVQGATISVHLMNYQIVCLALGSRIDRYRMVSVIARYSTSAVETPVTDQFHFQCVSNVWSIFVFGNAEFSMSLSPPVGSLTTPERQDCRFCTDRTAGSTPAEHCVGKLVN